jgi:hypothetical protein
MTALFSSYSFGQSQPVDIGDMAPPLRPEVWMQGAPITEFEKGQVYVLVFWNPTISAYAPALPHLTEEMRQSVHFISIDTHERYSRAEGPNMEARRTRIETYLHDHPAAMQTSICLDDWKDTIFNRWISSDGKQPLMHSAIVDRQGQVAWIGKTSEVEKPLVQICRGSFDKIGFKRNFEEKVSNIAAHVQIGKDIEEAAKKGDTRLVDGLLQKLDGWREIQISQTIYFASKGDPEFALTYMKGQMPNYEYDVDAWQWCYLLSQIAQASKLEATKREALSMSATYLGRCRRSELALAETYHALILASLGQRDEAIETIGKAKADIKRFNAARQAQFVAFVDNIRKTIQ